MEKKQRKQKKEQGSLKNGTQNIMAGTKPTIAIIKTEAIE